MPEPSREFPHTPERSTTDSEPSYPAVMRLKEVAAAMGTTPKTIYDQLSDGIFLPLPFAEHPYRWRGADILSWYRGEYRQAIADLKARRRERLKRSA